MNNAIVRVLLCSVACAGFVFLSSASAAAQPPQRIERITCESIDGRRNVCEADIRGKVSLARQISDRPCVEGRNWGWNARGIWVDNGCRGEFVFESWQRGGGGYGRGPGYGNVQQVRCESNDNRRNFCPAEIAGDVRIRRQLSGRACVEGRNWGWNSQGIWVDNGCRAEFEYVEGRGRWGGRDDRRGRRNDDDERDRRSYVLTCESDNNRYRECRLDRPSEVRIARQLSGARCERNRSWGVSANQRSVWVNNGCRAEFEVTPR